MLRHTVTLGRSGRPGQRFSGSDPPGWTPVHADGTGARPEGAERNAGGARRGADARAAL
ncbi:hypothetical protein SSCG_05027 [Streptomyces clavuligerus]|nr:hypothetical protein SSCG_05027 [Streptomyces clavuligerus]